MTEQDLEMLTGWLRERMPGYQLQWESRDGMHVFEVRKSEKEKKKEKKRQRRPDGENGSAVLIFPDRFSNGDEWPSLAELQRAMETASVASLLTKGRRLRLRADEQEEMRKVWVEDLDPSET